MAVSIGTVTTAANNVTSVSSVTWAHTCDANTTMLVIQSGYVRVGNSPISSVTYNGTSCTLGVKSYPGANVHAENYYLLSPPTSSSYNIVVTYPDSSTFEPKNGAICFLGSETSSFTGATATGGANGTNPSSGVSITTNADNSIIVNVIGDNGGMTGSNDTQQWVGLNNPGSFDGGGSTKTTTTAGSYSMSWAGGGADNWSVAMMEIKESSSPTAFPRLALLGVGR